VAEATAARTRGVTLTVSDGGDREAPQRRAFLARRGHAGMYCDPGIVDAVARGLRQTSCVIEAWADGRIVGLLPLVSMKSLLFGRFLVSLPYTNWAGAIAEDQEIARRLIDRAIALTDEFGARFLELRHTQPVDHPSLVPGATDKVQMRLALSRSADDNWKALKSEVRTQIRKAKKQELEVAWGGSELLEEFYAVFARNMRDLGTPVFPRDLFRNILDADPDAAELGVVRLSGTPIATCLAVHGPGLTEIPSAAALRAYRNTAANSLLYWSAIERAIARGQQVFDFGRSTPESATFVFKRKWGAEPSRVVWQYYVREGDTQAMRPENRKFQLAIRMWQQLPVPVTRILGPMIVRGIP
jgi:FemAB-related protein (PEP-CTERM system-associated)